MDKKIIAVAVVAVIVVAAVGVYFLTQDNDEDTYSIIGRVNTEGSGIFLESTEDPEDYIEARDEAPTNGEAYIQAGETYYILHTENWRGKVFADPGNATIQHVQLQTIVQAMGLELRLYTTGTSTSSSDNYVYYVPNVGTYATYELQRDANNFVGGFIWEAQYSIALQDGCQKLITTNELFPAHTCCVVGASNDYITSHSDETVRFLAAYIDSVNRLQDAINNTDSEDYQKLMEVALDKVAMPDTMSQTDKIAAIQHALTIVTYNYCDDETAADPLSKLRSDIADLVEQFQAGGNVEVTYDQLGFASADDLADSFVKSQYIKDAIDGNYDADGASASITVAVITGDIHQIAIHYGVALGIFENYGINVNVVPQINGPGVFSAISNGTAQFGFIGAPPMTTNSMNSHAISE